MYELYLTDPLGTRIGVMDAFLSLNWSKALNSVGAMTLTFGSEQVDWRLWALDRRIEVWRTATIPKLMGIFYLRGVERKTDPNGQQSVVWTGEDANGFLDRRIIAYYAGTAQAEKTDYADDMLKDFVRENLGSSAGVGRDLTNWGFTVALDYGLAPAITKSASRERLLATLQGVCDASKEEGTRLYFQVVHPTLSTLEFRTYVNRQGSDRTATPDPFSLSRGTLSGPVTVRQDHSAEVNYVYVGGQGTEEDREIVELSDATAIGASVFGRREGLVDGRQYEWTASLTAYGKAQLREGLTRNAFEATLQDMQGARYQEDWGLGDLVKAEYDEETYTCEVTAVMGSATPDSESISARLVSYA